MVSPGGKVVYSNGKTTESKLWFESKSFTREDVLRIKSVQLATYSRDQGWVEVQERGSWSWFDLGIVAAGSDNEEERKFRSHHNRLAEPEFAHREGRRFINDELAIEEGSIIRVYACAKYGGWKNDAETGVLRVWKCFEPVITL